MEEDGDGLGVGVDGGALIGIVCKFLECRSAGILIESMGRRWHELSFELLFLGQAGDSAAPDVIAFFLPNSRGAQGSWPLGARSLPQIPNVAP
jgi:hypothetical protein